MVDGTAVSGLELATARVGEARVAGAVAAPVVDGDGAVLQTPHQDTLRGRVGEVGVVQVVRAARAVETLWRCGGGGDLMTRQRNGNCQNV